MNVIFNGTVQKKPIKAWINPDSIEPSCLLQAEAVSNLPYLFKHVALMPDCHMGHGMPVGGVAALKGAISPNMVGVDIGCGMVYVHTDIPVKELKAETPNGTMTQKLVGQLMRNIPTGFQHRAMPIAFDPDVLAEYKSLETFLLANSIMDSALWDRVFPEAHKQLGTLGGGNHFIELQEDEQGLLAIMIHSGSRNVGKVICDFYNKEAERLNTRWHSEVPKGSQLAFLPTDAIEGAAYIRWMMFAQKFAMQNRAEMMKMAKLLVGGEFPGVKFDTEINAHHNYAALENHFGENVWVHRKGAIRVREGELGIIPGAMGSFSYIVRGKGNPESFMSCSHGAGRAMSRTKAKQSFTVQSVIEELKTLNVTIGKSKMEDVAEECKGAYKDIDVVMKDQEELVEPVTKLKTVAVIKG